MAVTWTFGSINLNDHTKYQAFEGDENPNFDIQIKAGCGGGDPTVTKFRPVYWVQPITVVCLGSTADTVKTNRDALLAEVTAANATPGSKTLTRKPTTQTNSDTWKILGAVPKRINRHWDGIKKTWIALDVYVYPL